MVAAKLNRKKRRNGKKNKTIIKLNNNNNNNDNINNNVTTINACTNNEGVGSAAVGGNVVNGSLNGQKNLFNKPATSGIGSIFNTSQMLDNPGYMDFNKPQFPLENVGNNNNGIKNRNGKRLNNMNTNSNGWYTQQRLRSAQSRPMPPPPIAFPLIPPPHFRGRPSPLNRMHPMHRPPIIPPPPPPLGMGMRGMRMMSPPIKSFLPLQNQTVPMLPPTPPRRPPRPPPAAMNGRYGPPYMMGRNMPMRSPHMHPPMRRPPPIALGMGPMAPPPPPLLPRHLTRCSNGSNKLNMKNHRQITTSNNTIKKLKQIVNNYPINKSWVTKEIKEAHAKKVALEEQLKGNKNDVLFAEFKVQRDKFVKLYEAARLQFNEKYSKMDIDKVLIKSDKQNGEQNKISSNTAAKNTNSN